jgi:hypothetical protein
MPGPDNPRERRILKASDDVLRSVAELKDLERRKRKQNVSTPEYHALADEAQAKSREIFRAAREETAAANDLESGSRSIDEMAADEGDAPKA